MVNQSLQPFNFESVAQVYELCDLQQWLIPLPSATFMMRMSGNAMESAGILEGDYLIVDRSLEVTNNKLVVVALNDEFLIRYYCKADHQVKLFCSNQERPDIYISPQDSFTVWGLVSGVIRKNLPPINRSLPKTQNL